MEEEISQKIFKKGETIGTGGFGSVYRVKNKKTKQKCAAKVSSQFLDPSSPYFGEDFKSLSREVNILRGLDHISILKFIGFSKVNFDNEPYPIIITEYICNGSLRSILSFEERGVPPKEWNMTKKLIIIYGIASGMAFLHENHIIHRDLKPENILLDDYLFPKICDFGLSKIYDPNKRSLQSMSGGTLHYMAPEIFSQEKYN